MGAWLLAAGKKGKRFALPNSRVMIHQPLIGGVMQGTATDLAIEAKEMIRLRQRMFEILAHHTGQTVEKIHKDCDRNLWLEAEEAIAYGVIDEKLGRMAAPTPSRGSDMAPPGGDTEAPDQ